MMTKEIGETVKSRIRSKVCVECDCLIGTSGDCSYGCSQDYNLARRPGTVIIRVWERTDVLVDQKVR